MTIYHHLLEPAPPAATAADRTGSPGRARRFALGSLEFHTQTPVAGGRPVRCVQVPAADSRGALARAPRVDESCAILKLLYRRSFPACGILGFLPIWSVNCATSADGTRPRSMTCCWRPCLRRSLVGGRRAGGSRPAIGFACSYRSPRARGRTALYRVAIKSRLSKSTGTPDKLRNWSPWCPSISRELGVIRRWELDRTLLFALRLAGQIPGGIRRMAQSPKRRATCIATYLGRGFSRLRLPKIPGGYQVGNLQLHDLEMLSPLLPQTPASWAFFEFRGEIIVSLHADLRVLGGDDAQRLLAEFHAAVCGLAQLP